MDRIDLLCGLVSLISGIIGVYATFRLVFPHVLFLLFLVVFLSFVYGGFWIIRTVERGEIHEER